MPLYMGIIRMYGYIKYPKYINKSLLKWGKNLQSDLEITERHNLTEWPWKISKLKDMNPFLKLLSSAWHCLTLLDTRKFNAIKF